MVHRKFFLLERKFFGLVQGGIYIFLSMKHTYSQDIANFPNRHIHTHDRPDDSQCCPSNLIFGKTHESKIKEGRIGAVRSTETRKEAVCPRYSKCLPESPFFFKVAAKLGGDTGSLAVVAKKEGNEEDDP